MPWIDKRPEVLAAVPNPHGGARCPASADGGVGFYVEERLGRGLAQVECPNGCGWWRVFNVETGEIIDGSHNPTSPDSGSDQ